MKVTSGKTPIFHGRRPGVLAGIMAVAILLSGCAALNEHRNSPALKVGNAARPAFANPHLVEQSNGVGTPDPTAYTRKPDVTLRPSDTHQCKPLVMKRGQRLALRLPANPDSGLAWQLDDHPDGLRLLSPPRALDATARDHTNDSVIFDWRFAVTGASQGQLRLLYHDAQHQNKAPRQVFECNIVTR